MKAVLRPFTVTDPVLTVEKLLVQGGVTYRVLVTKCVRISSSTNALTDSLARSDSADQIQARASPF